MNTKINNKQWAFIIATILWMGIIFYFSAQTADESTTQSSQVSMILGNIMYRDFDSWSMGAKLEFSERISNTVRKTAHAIEYAILGFLLQGAVDFWRNFEIKKAIVVWLLGTIYAISDETHQFFVEGRSAQAGDVAIDSFGAFLMIIIVTTILLIKKQRKQNV